MKNKKIILTTATIAILASSAFAYAQSSDAPVVDNSGRTVSAIQELGNKIEALAKASVKSVNQLAYQLDKSFTNAVDLNSQQQNIQDRTRDRTHTDADNNIKQALQPFAEAALTYTSSSQPEVKKVYAERDAREKYLKSLQNVEASDTIYSLVQGIDASSYWTHTNTGRSAKINNDAFNFAALIEPDAYNAEQEKNSQYFLGYAAKQYNSYTEGLNLGQLRDTLNKYKTSSPKDLGQKIAEFRNDPAYKKFQLSVRSTMASKSVATDILTGLAAERKPIRTTSPDAQLDAVSRAIGVTPKTLSLADPENPGQKITLYTYASPMQIAKYRANYRLNDKNWYQEVAGDSAENLQRKSVVLLAEISSQLYQNHLDNEKVLGALAMMNLQSNGATEMLLKTQVADVNKSIATFSGQSTANTQSNTITNSGTPSSTDYSNYDTSNIDTSNIDTSTVPTTTP